MGCSYPDSSSQGKECAPLPCCSSQGKECTPLPCCSSQGKECALLSYGHLLCVKHAREQSADYSATTDMLRCNSCRKMQAIGMI